MKYQYEYEKREHATHKELVDEIISKPTMIAADFKPIGKEIEVLRGRIDILGKLGDSFCILEVKVSNQGGLMLEAKKQLYRYSKAINRYMYLFGREEVKFKYILVRKFNHILKINIFETVEEIIERGNID